MHACWMLKQAALQEATLCRRMPCACVLDAETAHVAVLLPADGSGSVCRDEFSQLLNALHSQAARPSVSLRKSAGTTE